jgi:tetratricopeptide (TPR) repeat protein
MALEKSLTDDMLRSALDFQKIFAMVKINDEAIKDLTESIRLDPNYVYAYSRRGSAYRQLGQKDQAREDLEKALSIDPDDEFAKSEMEKLQGGTN